MICSRHRKAVFLYAKRWIDVIILEEWKTGTRRMVTQDTVEVGNVAESRLEFEVGRGN